MTIDLETIGAGGDQDESWCVCRCCGHHGDDVLGRVRRHNEYAHVDAKDLNKLRLCDLCACVGAVCSGASGSYPVGNIPMQEFAGLLRTAIWMIRDGATPIGDDTPLAREFEEHEDDTDDE